MVSAVKWVGHDNALMSPHGRLSSGLALLLLAALGLRTAFLGYAPLYHAEADFASAIAYVLPCLQRLSFVEAWWRQWHLFILGGNPWYWLYPVNVPVAWIFGLSDTTTRLVPALAGVGSWLAAPATGADSW